TVRAAVNVVAERDELVVGRGFHPVEEGVEVAQTAVNVADGQHAHRAGSARKWQYNSRMPILLFDIDGTLVRTGGAGKAAMEAALRDEFGVREIRDVVAYSGRTDRAIGRDLLTVHGIEPTPANQAKLQAAYLAHLPPSLKRLGGVVCPGIHE